MKKILITQKIEINNQIKHKLCKEFKLEQRKLTKERKKIVIFQLAIRLRCLFAQENQGCKPNQELMMQFFFKLSCHIGYSLRNRYVRYYKQKKAPCPLKKGQFFIALSFRNVFFCRNINFLLGQLIASSFFHIQEKNSINISQGKQKNKIQILIGKIRQFICEYLLMLIRCQRSSSIKKKNKNFLLLLKFVAQFFVLYFINQKYLLEIYSCISQQIRKQKVSLKKN
ncbi:hypothetical protein ABPG72_014208 [Tetrahymena utriculariae]